MKQKCGNCGTKHYGLPRKIIVCQCGASFRMPHDRRKKPTAAKGKG